jgi:hypothetical protein
MKDPIILAAPPPVLAGGDADAEFIARARHFLIELGVNPASLDPDVDLVDSGVLDSLLLLAFLAFVEEQRGHEAPLEPEDVVAIRRLRTASALVRSRVPGT